MKLLCFFLLCCTAFLLQTWCIEGACEYLDGYSNQIYFRTSNRRNQNYQEKCWYIEPPQESIINIKFLEYKLGDPYCDNVYIEVSDYNEKKEKVCQHYSHPDWTGRSLTMMGTANITLVMRYAWDYISLSFEYKVESVACLSKNSFRCTSHQCIPSEQVCDGVEDCKNGLDESQCGISAIEGANSSRIKGINWLKSHQTNFGLGRNTHRAVTTLYLTGAAKFRGKNADEELIVKQLQLKTAISLMRNLTEPISVNELSMYVNALLVTCHNVRNVFSEDLLEILASRAFSKSPASPGAYLTLCNANWPFSEKNIYSLLNLLTKDIEYPFALEIKAMTLMALSCLEEKNSFIYSMHNASSLYNETVEHFMASQKQDGSFGNVHTTAIVTQALISSGRMENSTWNSEKALKFLIKNLNSSSVDFLSVYLSLPLFRGKTLLDIGNIACSDYQRKLEEDEDILDVMDKIGTKIQVQYSLYIGDSKNVIQNIYLKVPENSTIYDVMNVAQIADHKYKFSYHKANGHVYVYEIAGLTNDMEAGKFWLFFTSLGNNSELKHFTQSPDQIVMSDKEHLVMWYKSANI